MLLFRFTPSKISSAGRALLKTEWEEKSERRRGVEQNRQRNTERGMRRRVGVQPWMPYSLGGRISSVCHCDLEAAYKDVQTHADAHVCLYIEVHLGVWEYVIMSNDYYYLKSSNDFTTLGALKVFGKSSRFR